MSQFIDDDEIPDYEKNPLRQFTLYPTYIKDIKDELEATAKILDEKDGQRELQHAYGNYRTGMLYVLGKLDILKVIDEAK